MRDLRAWQERLGRLSAPHPDSWTPPIDVYETDTRYVVAAEVPGLPHDQIELAFEASRLTIRGRRVDHGTRAEDIVHFHQVEHGHGAFSRTLDFADKTDVSGVAADLSNGVLTITLPKALPPPRRMEVR